MKRDDYSALAAAVFRMASLGGYVLEACSFQGPGHVCAGQARGQDRAHATRTSTGAVITSLTSGAGASSK